MKILLFIVLYNVLFISSVFAQWITESPKYIPKPDNILDDISSHMSSSPSEYDNIHECTHALNADLRNRYPLNHQPVNCFYVLNNTFVRLIEPPITLTYVAQHVPTSLRKSIYGLYLQQAASSWNNQPLYIFDEFISYINGTKGYLADQQYTSAKHSLKCALEFISYSLVLVSCLPPTYNDNFLKSFVEYTCDECVTLYKTCKKLNLLSDSDKTYFSDIDNNPSLKSFCISYFGPEWYNDTILEQINKPKLQLPHKKLNYSTGGFL
jgi:hypothetical protein